MKSNIISDKEEREKIFALFIINRNLKFNEIEKAIKIKSNHLNYHLQKLIEEEVIEKSGDSYKLTKAGEKFIPFYAQISGKEQGPLSIVAAAIINRGKICLLKRNNRPYQGYWGIIGGKLKLDESIKQRALREAKEETGLDCEFVKVSAVLHERVKDSKDFKHSFVIFLCKLKTNQTEFKETGEGELKWFSLAELPKKIIPSDVLMIEKLLKGRFLSKDIIINEEEGELKNMEVKDGGSM